MSVQDADALAAADPYQFQWWALGLVGARPAEGKKGADQGIDGRIYFHDGDTGKTKQIVISVNRRDKLATCFGALVGSCRSQNLLPDLLGLVWSCIDRNEQQRVAKSRNGSLLAFTFVRSNAPERKRLVLHSHIRSL